MRKFKICILGEFGVGKTSIVNRFVKNHFDSRYLSTIGVSILSKDVALDGAEIRLIIWDIAGHEGGRIFTPNYLKGMSGYVVVGDGSVGRTREICLGIERYVENLFGDVPHVFMFNKCDRLQSSIEMEIEARKMQALEKTVFITSAKTGARISDAFTALLRKIFERETEYETDLRP